MFAYCNNNPILRCDDSGQAFRPTTVTLCDGGSEGVYCGAAPQFVGEFGTAAYGDPWAKTSNCYTYALGYYGMTLNPGSISGKPFQMDVDSVANSVLSDLEYWGRGGRILSGPNAYINRNEYRIALRVKKEPSVVSFTSMRMEDIVYDWDYHFMVQTSTGQWAEKHGRAGSSLCHEAGMTPATISWDLEDQTGYYDSEIVYIAVTRR